MTCCFEVMTPILMESLSCKTRCLDNLPFRPRESLREILFRMNEMKINEIRFKKFKNKLAVLNNSPHEVKFT